MICAAPECGKEFNPNPQRPNHHHCSKKCTSRNRYLRTRILTPKVPYECELCGRKGEDKRKRRFCSEKCAYTVLNRKMVENRSRFAICMGCKVQLCLKNGWTLLHVTTHKVLVSYHTFLEALESMDAEYELELPRRDRWRNQIYAAAFDKELNPNIN
jgi:endogenous inhibitor of DNA gyrase (YacG/DUF329 family)